MEENSQQHLPQQNESIISNVQAGLARKNSRGVSPSSYTQLPGSGGSGNSSASNIIPIAPGGGSGGVSGNNSSNYSINALANVNKSLATLDAKKEVASALSSNNLEAAALSSSAADNVWQIICVRVLPLFNGEGVKGCVEDLNELVSVWVKETPNTLIPEEFNELLNAGMLTLTSKLNNVGLSSSHSHIPEESVLVAARISELWNFFFGTVLPYLQGVFLPIRMIVKRRGGDPELIDVRRMGLESFRTNIVLPSLTWLEDALPKLLVGLAVPTDISGRLKQMLFILYNLGLQNDPIRDRLINKL